MGESLLKKALSCFRIDGSWEAPIKFLTIEDGEGYEPGVLNSLESFRNKLDEDSQFIPSAQNPLQTKVGLLLGGRPGIYIAKIMTNIISGTNDAWDIYRKESLYKNNEANVKFYPLALVNSYSWPNKLNDYLGIELEDYRQYCQLLRPGFIAKKFGVFRKQTRLFIIMGAYYEWLTVLGHAMSGIDPSQIRLCSILFNNNKSKFRFWQFQDQEGVQITWAHFPVFTRGLCDDDVPRFCKKLRELVPGIADGLSTGWSKA